MDTPSVFRYPRSGLFLARLLLAMGFGPKSWPGRIISATTFKRILADDPPTFVLRDFIDEALGLLGSPSGRWDLGPVPMTREQILELIYTGLRGYDKAVSELNGSSSLVGADRRHALPILTLLAVRLGAIVGLLAAIREEPLDEVWPRTLLDPGAFGRAVSRYAEQAMPAASWRERGEESPIGKNTLDRWRTTPPGESFKFASLKKFARWVAEKCGSEAAGIEWHLCWLAAGARLHGALDRYLGRDTHGEPWIDRLTLTAQHHARINFELYTQKIGLTAAIPWLEPGLREGLTQEQDLGIRRLFAWLCGRAQVLDGKDGPALSNDEMALLRAGVADDAAIRRGFEVRLGVAHALGILAPGYTEAIHVHHGCLDQYLVQHKDPAGYLKLQHDLIAEHIERADRELDLAFVDDHIAAVAKMVFSEERAEPFIRHVRSRIAPHLADPTAFALGVEATRQLIAFQHELAGDPFVRAPAPTVTDHADKEIGGVLKLLELRRTLPKLAESGDEAALARELERATREYPEMVEPAFWYMRLCGKQLLEQYQQILVLTAQNQVLLTLGGGPQGSAAFSWYRKVIGRRRTLLKLQASCNVCFDAVLSALLGIAEKTTDRWAIDLTRQGLAGGRAAISLICHQQMPRLRQKFNHDMAVQSLQACIGPLLELHEARPEHPRPCVLLAQSHALLGYHAEARRWARLAEKRGDPVGLQALDTS